MENRECRDDLDPLFDQQASYSTGCISLDPQNPSTVWVGTGENVGGRHVAYGDGIYRSKDGKNWENLGLKGTEHISKIIIHPNNSDVVWVAARVRFGTKAASVGFIKPPMEEKLETSPGRFSLDGCYRPHHRSPQSTSTLCSHLGPPPHRRCFNEWWTRFRHSQIYGRWRNLGRTYPRTPQLQYGEKLV